MTRPIRILGIDPGLRRTGWGVVEIAGNRLGFIGCGSVTSNDRDDMATRLLAIHDGLTRILDEFRPDEAAVEATFVNKDAQATLKLGQARGIAMVVPAKAGVPVAEYAPNVVKKSIVGSGRQGAGAHDDRRAVAQGRPGHARRRRCARHRGDARASSTERGAQGGCDVKGCGAMIGEKIILIFPPPERGRSGRTRA